MQIRTIITTLLIVLWLDVFNEARADPFTYQGELQTGGVPTSGLCDFRFTLFDASGAGSQVGTIVDLPAQPVLEGIFTVDLDFGTNSFGGEDRWIEIEVRCPASIGNFALLSPRQQVQPTPYAMYALNAGVPFSFSGNDASFLGGKVGIGTSTPGSILHLVNNGPEISIRMKSAASWTAEIRQTDSSLLSIINGGADRLVITPNGRFGFNTTAPNAALHVVSDFDPGLRLEAASDSGQDTGLAIVGARNASTTVDAAYIDFRDFDDDQDSGTEFSMAKIGAGMADVSGLTGFLRFYTSAGAGLQERMRLNSDGRVFIGEHNTATLTDLLSVTGDVAIGGGTTFGNEDGGSEHLRIRGFLDDWYLGVRNFPGAAETNFFIGLNDADYNRFHFSPAGNLGLGTVPTSKLHLASAGSLRLHLEADTDNSGEADQPAILLTQDGGLISGEVGFFDQYNSLSIRSNDAGAGASHILLEPEGRIGIGVVAPQTYLDVQGPGTATGGVSGNNNVLTRFRQTTASQHTAVSIDALSGQDAILYLGGDGSAKWSLRNDENDPLYTIGVFNLRYHHENTNFTVFKVINRGAPAFAINPGQDNAVTLGSAGFGASAYQEVYSYNFSNVSDRRSKRDIRALEYGIREIMALEPVRFRWRDQTDTDDALGLIAQDVLAVLPEAVTGDESIPGSRLGIRYSDIVPVLISGIQEQQNLIENLYTRQDELLSRLDHLESLLIEIAAEGQP